jgi:hypothetical protein
MQFPSRSYLRDRFKESANQNHPLKWNISPFMPCRFPTTPPRGGATPALCRLVLALLHLTVIATAHAAHQTLAIPKPVSRPYLASISSPALRFVEANSAPPMMVKPVAGGPPVVANAPEVAEVNLANNQAAASTPPMPMEPAQPIPPAEGKSAKADEPATQAAKPKPILPDDTRPKLQSQDFLPLFRFPGSGGPSEDVTPAVPAPSAPGTLPPSSATYTQH